MTSEIIRRSEQSISTPSQKPVEIITTKDFKYEFFDGLSKKSTRAGRTKPEQFGIRRK